LKTRYFCEPWLLEEQFERDADPDIFLDDRGPDARPGRRLAEMSRRSRAGSRATLFIDAFFGDLLKGRVDPVSFPSGASRSLTGEDRSF